MIGVLTGAEAAAALGGLNTGFAGMNQGTAWDASGMSTDYDVGFGVADWTSNTPAISGNTSSSITDSSESDPLEAFENQEDYDVSDISGGTVEGSTVGTFVYSLMVEHPGATEEVVKAVTPVAVPVAQAYTAISQALGVSMDAAEMDVETKAAFARSITSGTDLIYDAAQDLVKAWWDGANILFPRSAVQAVEDLIISMGIGSDSGSIGTQDQDTYYGHHYEVPTAETGLWVASSGSLASVEYIPDDGSIVIRHSGGSLASIKKTSGFSGTRIRRYTDEPERVNTYGPVEGIRATIDRTRETFYYANLGPGSTPASTVPDSPTSDGEVSYPTINTLADIVFNGTETSGGYPEGMYESIAPKYKTSDLPTEGKIAKTKTELSDDIVKISLPQDPYDTRDSTADPNGPTDDDTVTDLPFPPIPYPIPDTNVSNPDVPLTNPSVVDSTVIDQLVNELANTLDPQPPQSSGIIPIPLMPGIPDGQGGSSFPSIVPASGSGLIHVYNPTPGEFVSFGNWLWVTYADASIEKIWNNPFDGIIGAHELYATPQVDGSDNIRSGFLTCPTTAALVRQRYTEIDCGTIIVPEFYGNYLDYSPYSQAYIYLPFIGINEVSIDDIVGHAINIRYRVDAYNGSCIAMIWVAKNGYRNLCYQFAGNCAVEVPLAGGSQAAIKAGMMQAEAYSRAAMVSAAGHALGGLGSALMGSLGGALSSIGSIANDYANAKAGVEAARVANKSSVQHSGSFGASHGAMGNKTPFIIIRNPIQVKVVNYNDDYGFPAHKRVIVGGCTGYLRVREVNVISASATDEEKAMIEALLKNGVYVQ